MSNARFSILQSRAVEDKRISNAQFRTLAALGMYGDKEGYCFPHLKTLGDSLGKSKQAVSKDLQSLADLGYIEITRQYRNDGSQMGNLYRLLFDLPRQPDDYPHQRGVDTHQPQMLTPVSSDVDPPSTSEVDALTTQVNDPYNALSEEELASFIYTELESICGMLNTSTPRTVDMWIDTYETDWIMDALKIARDNEASSPNYVSAILKKWQAKGRKDISNGRISQQDRNKALLDEVFNGD